MNGDFGGATVAGYEEARDASGAVTAVRLRLTPPNRSPMLITLTLEPPASPNGVTRVAGIELQMGD